MKNILLTLALFACVTEALPQVQTLTSPCQGTFSRKTYFFDIQSLNNIRITGFSLMSQNCGTRDMSLYYRQGPFLGFESNPAAWTFLDSISNFNPLCSLSCPIPPTQIPFELNVCIPEGATYSFLIATTGGTGSIESHNLQPQGSVGAQDTNLILYTGIGHNDLAPFNANGSMVNGLTWQGEIFYQPLSLNLGNDTTLCQGQQLALSPGTGFASYLWSTGDTSSVVTVDSSGIYYLSATTTSGCTLTDSIEVNVVICSGLEETNTDPELFLIYPNPAQNVVNISFAHDTKVGRVTVTDITGKEISETILKPLIKNDGIKITTDDIADGYYVIKLECNGIAVCRPFIKSSTY